MPFVAWPEIFLLFHFLAFVSVFSFQCSILILVFFVLKWSLTNKSLIWRCDSIPLLGLVEMRRVELLTSCLQGRRSPNWATPPHRFFILLFNLFLDVWASSKLRSPYVLFLPIEALLLLGKGCINAS